MIDKIRKKNDKGNWIKEDFIYISKTNYLKKKIHKWLEADSFSAKGRDEHKIVKNAEKKKELEISENPIIILN